MKDILETHPVTNLKSILRNIKGDIGSYSKMKKAELIDKIIELKKKGFPVPKVEKYVKPERKKPEKKAEKKPEPKKAGGGTKPEKPAPVQGPRNLVKGFGIKRTEKKPEVSEQKLREIQMSLGTSTYNMANILRNVNDNKLSKAQMAKLKKELPQYKEFEEDVKLLEANAKPKSLAETYVKNYRKHMKIIENLEMPEKKKEELVPKLTKAQQDKLYGEFKPGDLFMNYDNFNKKEYIYQLLHFKGRAGNKIMLGAVAIPETERNEKERKTGSDHKYSRSKEIFYRGFPGGSFKPIKLENLEKYKRITTPVTLSPHAYQSIKRRVIFKGSPLKKYTKKDHLFGDPKDRTDYDEDYVENTYY